MEYWSGGVVVEWNDGVMGQQKILNTPILQYSNSPILQFSNTPILL